MATGSAFSARMFFPSPVSDDIGRTPANAQRADAFGGYTPPSTLISLHQKLDLVLASSNEQKAAIDELQRDNSSLKQQLQEVSTELQAFKEADKQLSTQSGKRSSSKLPTAVSVSYLAFYATAIAIALSRYFRTCRHQQDHCMQATQLKTSLKLP